MPTSSDLTDVAIRCEEIGKRYRIGERERYATLRDTLARTATRVLRRSNGATTDESAIWALEDVSFEVRRGEVLGIIGRNGAGKSTLLKILSRITKPTRGRATIHGRIGSLLEVGTGFHPELTGRENVFLNGAILGMKRREMEQQFDAIVAFAEIDEFLDTPVKRYSSGMYMRLAFAVAAHLDPDILVIDEVLAVGDAAFQKKCVGKMRSAAKSGRTILLVSHTMPAIQSLCHRVLWLDEGKIASQGRPDAVIRDYLKIMDMARVEQVWSDPLTAPGNERVRVRRAAVRAADGSNVISTDKPFVLEFEYWNLVSALPLHVGIFLHNEQGITVLYSEPAGENEMHPVTVGLFRDACTMPGNLLNDGTYQVDLLFIRNEDLVVLRLDQVLLFDVHETAERQRAWYSKWPGTVRPPLKWRTALLKEGEPVATER